MKYTKKYAFSMTKHAHDLFYRYNVVKNLYEDWDPEYTSAEDYEESKRLYDLMNDLQDLLSKGGGIVWLTGKEYGLAKETVLWADAMRHERRS